MELFEQVIKYLPVMHKHAKLLFAKIPPEKRFGNWKMRLAEEMLEWIWDELLDEHLFLYQTFLKAGYTNKLDMSVAMFQWYLMDDRLNRKSRKP